MYPHTSASLLVATPQNRAFSQSVVVEVATVANALSVQTVAAPQTVGAATENVQYEVVDYYLAQYAYLVASVV